MKNIFKSGCIFVIVLVSFVSCKNLFSSFAVPESVSVKSKALFNASLGSVSDTLSNYISASILQDNIGTSATVYDYNPGGSASVQEYLIDYPITTWDLNFSSLVNTQALSSGLGNMTFDDYTLNIPAVNQSLAQSVTFDTGSITSAVGTPSLNKTVAIPEPGSSATINDVSVPMSIGVDSVTYESGTLTITLVYTSSTGTPSGTKTVTVSLRNSSGSVIATGSGSASGSSSIAVPLDLAGKTLTKSMTLIIGGTVSGGSAGIIDSYSLSAGFSDAVISRVTGVSGTLSGTVASQSVSAANPQVQSATIGTGSVYLRSAAPSGWSGVTCVLAFGSTPNISGAVSGSFSDASTDGYLFYKTLDLSGKTYTPGTVTVSGADVTLTLSSATLTFSGGKAVLPVEGVCSITKLSSVTVSVSDALPSFTMSKTLNELSSGTISSVTNPSMLITGSFKNGLPSGNTVKVLSSLTLGSSTSGTKTSSFDGGVAESQSFTNAVSTGTLSSGDNVGATTDILLPGQTVSTDAATLTNIALGTDYTFSASVSMTMDWSSVTVNDLGSKLSSGGTVSTSIDFDKIFSDFSSTIDRSKFSITRIPAYLYVVVPSAVKTALSGTPTLNLTYSGTNSSGGTVSGQSLFSGTAALLSSGVNLGSTSSAYTGTLTPDSCSAFTDVFTSVINGGASITSITYGISNLTGSSTTISKSDLGSSSTVSVKAVIELPLDLTIATGGMTVDVAEMSKVYDSADEDLLHRGSDYDSSDITKYTDAIEYFRLNYTMNNPLTVAGGALTLSVKDSNSGLDMDLSTSGTSVDLTGEQITNIMKSTVFHPSMVLSIPEGKVTVPRDCSFGMNAKVQIKTNGTVKVWGD